jgi:hypothetical protein
MSVAVIVAIMAMSVPVISFIVTMAMVIAIVAAAVVAVVFVLAVVMAVVMADFFAVFAGVEIPFPAAVASPVGMLAPNREPAVVAETRVVCAIDISPETDRAVEPRARSEEDSAGKPCWSVIAERGATIGRVVVIAVWADRLNADVDGDLYFGLEGRGREAEKREKRKCDEAQ